MTASWYRPKRKDDLISHLILSHDRDHVVALAMGGTRTATESERRALYANGWTVARLTERHDTMHAERIVRP